MATIAKATTTKPGTTNKGNQEGKSSENEEKSVEEPKGDGVTTTTTRESIVSTDNKDTSSTVTSKTVTPSVVAPVLPHQIDVKDRYGYKHKNSTSVSIKSLGDMMLSDNNNTISSNQQPLLSDPSTSKPPMNNASLINEGGEESVKSSNKNLPAIDQRSYGQHFNFEVGSKLETADAAAFDEDYIKKA